MREALGLSWVCINLEDKSRHRKCVIIAEACASFSTFRCSMTTITAPPHRGGRADQGSRPDRARLKVDEISWCTAWGAAGKSPASICSSDLVVHPYISFSSDTIRALIYSGPTDFMNRGMAPAANTPLPHAWHIGAGLRRRFFGAFGQGRWWPMRW